MRDDILTIGQLARAAGVNVETIRYYQRTGLINEPEKPARGYRHYPATALERIHFIKRAQRLGFNLREISELLVIGGERCSDVRQRAEEKHAQVDAQIKELLAMRSTLDELIQACHSNKMTASCPIIHALSDIQ